MTKIPEGSIEKLSTPIDTRQITKEELKAIEPLTKRHKTSLWGQESETTPTVVHTVFGDGGSVVTLEPANSRPCYYVILADSSFNCFEDFLRFMADNEELVLQAIEEEYGNVDDQQYDEDGYAIETPDDDWWEDGEMPLNIGSGYTTGYFNNQPFKD